MLPDNYILSKSRLVSLLSRLRNGPGVLEEYHAVIQEQLTAGIVERVEEDGPGGSALSGSSSSGSSG